MTYQEFTKNIEFGNTTAFVYDSPNNRYNYSSGEICDEVFDNVDSDTEFTIVGIDELPEVKEVIIDNFLSEIAPAAGIEDEGYNMVKKQLNNGKAKVGYWDEETHYGDTFTTRTYMLILIDQDAEEANVLIEKADELQQATDILTARLREEEDRHPAFVGRYAACRITWKDNGETEDVIVKLSSDYENHEDDPDDDHIFYYVDSLRDLASLTLSGKEEFVVDIDSINFFEKL